MARTGFAAVAGLLAVLALTACKRDTGECNAQGLTPDGRPIEGPAAFDIAYRSTDGLPMYEGQAIVQSSCGNAQFCHANAAERENRFGVPKGYDFDVSLACNSLLDPSCEDLEVCDDDNPSEFCQRFERLDDNRARCANEAGLMIEEIRRDYMPPGKAGEAVQDRTAWLQGPRASSPESRGPGTELPNIDSSEGQDIVRNWLACKAPVIGRTEPAPTVELELKPCDNSVDEANNVNCVFLGPPAEIPDPEWSSIYYSLVFTQCLSCHAPLNGNQDANPLNPLGGTIPGGADDNALTLLDLSGSDTSDTSNWPSESHAAVVDAMASVGGDCAGQVLVVPNDVEASLLVDKLRGTQDCGEVMPPNPDNLPSIISPVVEAVEEWINLGASNN